MELGEITGEWSGFLRIGVTGLSPEEISQWKSGSERDESGQTVVLGMIKNKLYAWVKGEVRQIFHLKSEYSSNSRT